MTEKKATTILWLIGIWAFFLIFGTFFGPRHPQIFFWGTLLSCILIIAKVTTIKIGQFIKLSILVVILAFIGEKINGVITGLFGSNNWLVFIAAVIFLAPCYIPCATYFFKICMQDKGNKS